MTGAAVELVILSGAAVIWEISAARGTARRIAADIQKQLEPYRTVLVLPARLIVEKRPEPQRPRPVEPEPPPLEIPDERILARMDQQVASFVKEHPEIESVVTREIARDLDRKARQIRHVLQASRIVVRLDLDSSGGIAATRVIRSCGVRSIDHLAVELLKVLEKHRIFATLKGLEELRASIRIGEGIEVELRGNAADSDSAIEARNRLQALFTLLRLGVSKETGLLLEDLTLDTELNAVIVGKTFEKGQILGFLLDYYEGTSRDTRAREPVKK